MSESLGHARGVAALERFARAHLGDGGDVIVYRDSVENDAQRKPPRVGGFQPDLLARAWKSGAFVIGEAKTARDLHTLRSGRQIHAFARAALAERLGTFVLAVPFHALPSARALLEIFTLENGLDRIVAICQEEYFDCREAS